MVKPIATDGIWNVWWNPSDRLLTIGNSKAFTSVILDEYQARNVIEALQGDRPLPPIRTGTWRHVIIDHFIRHHDESLSDDQLVPCGYPGHDSKVRHSLVVDGWLEEAGTAKNTNGRTVKTWRLTNKGAETINALT